MVMMVMGGGGAVRPTRGSAHPHPLAAQIPHDFRQQHHDPDPGTGLTQEKKEVLFIVKTNFLIILFRFNRSLKNVNTAMKEIVFIDRYKKNGE